MRFSTLALDCPWRYNSPGWKGGASNHYPTLPIEALREMPIPDLLEANSHLWLWTTDTHYESALELINYWGLKLRTKNQKKSQLIKRGTWDWIKLNQNPMTPKIFKEWVALNKPYVIYDGKPYKLQWANGYYKRSSKENLILATRGENICDDSARQVYDTFFAPVNEHSEKPKEAYDLIRSYSPETRLELFARSPNEGFQIWGNQAENSIILPCMDDWSKWAQEKYPENK